MMNRPVSAFLADRRALGAAALLVASLAAAPVWALAGAGRSDDPEVRVLVTPPAAPVAPGSRGEAGVLLSPPQGVKINRYPPVTLKLTEPKGLHLDATELKQGSTVPIDDPKDFPFKTLEPLKVGFTVDEQASKGKARVNGKINFVYCISRTEICMRTTREVSFDVAIAPAARKR